MTYVSGGDRLPPLTPVTYGPPQPKRTGHDWPDRETGPQEPPPMPTSAAAPHEQTRSGVWGQHPQTATMARLYAEGLSAPQVAAQLGIAAKTVRTHLKRAGIELRDDRTGQNLPKAGQ
jgi:hypothetical protein